jgi:hypothetical protein
MERTKLTIRVSPELLDKAKRYAQAHDTTLTRLVSAYLSQLSLEEDMLHDTPIVQRLSGVLPQDVSLESYREHLERKYGAPA